MNKILNVYLIQTILASKNLLKRKAITVLLSNFSLIKRKNTHTYKWFQSNKKIFIRLN
jgi:hypothetical protein